MTLRDEIATDAQAAWFDTDGLAQTVTYTQPSRELGIAEIVQEIPAVIAYGDNLGGVGRYLLEEMTAIIRRTDVALPRDGDSIILGEATWTVRKIKEGDGLGIAWNLGCTKGVRATQRQGS